jgi:hypothetical protein
MERGRQSKALVAAESRLPAGRSDALPASAEPFGPAIVVPTLVADAGDKAARRYANFFASIDNDNTRAAYSRACASVFAWCETKGIADLIEVQPFHVGAYVKAIGATHEKPTVKQSPRSACCSTGSSSAR